MKKILLASIATTVIALSAAPAFAASDPFEKEIETSWTDSQGNRFSNKLTTEAEDTDFIISSTVTWQDAAGNTYVNNGTTVTVMIQPEMLSVFFLHDK